jgi:transposase
MRLVAMKSGSAQASAAIFRTRDLLVRQCTQLIHAIRGQPGLGLHVCSLASRAC